jgi:hypothetical protein
VDPFTEQFAVSMYSSLGWSRIWLIEIEFEEAYLSHFNRDPHLCSWDIRRTDSSFTYPFGNDSRAITAN